MYTYQREPDGDVQEAGLMDLENKMEEALFASCHLVDIKIAIDSFLL